MDHAQFFDDKTNVIVQTNTSKNLPKNAVIVSKYEAMNLRLNQVYLWRPKSDVWAIRYGSWLLGAAATIPSLHFAFYYRRKFKLRSQGYVTMFAAMMFAPIYMATGIHNTIITVPLAAFEPTQCALCYEMKAGLVQVLCSTVYPVGLAGISGMMFASRYGSVDLPYYSDYKGLFKFFKNLSHPLLKTVAVVAMLEYIFANFITYMEAKQMYNYQEKIIQINIDKIEKPKN